MTRASVSMILLAVTMGTSLTISSFAQTTDKPATTNDPAKKEAKTPLDPEANIEEALTKKTSTDYYELPLRDARMHFKSQSSSNRKPCSSTGCQTKIL